MSPDSRTSRPAVGSWFREHVLQHHMYTNTPWDNHFLGTDPFLVTDPTTPRNWVQSRIMPYINPIILTFGLYGNWIAHGVDMLKGNEEWRVTKFILPLNIGLVVGRCLRPAHVHALDGKQATPLVWQVGAPTRRATHVHVDGRARALVLHHGAHEP